VVPRSHFPALLLALAVLTTVGTGDACAADTRQSVASTPKAVAPVQVRRLRFGIDDEKTRLVFEVSRDTVFRVAPGDDPNSVIVELPAADWAAGAVSGDGRGLVRGIDVAPGKSGGSRLTIRAGSRVAVKSAFKLPGDSATAPRVVVDIARAVGPAAAPTRDAPSLVPQPTMGYLKPPKPPQPTSPASLTAPAPTPPSVRPERERPSAIAPSRPAVSPLIVLDPGHGGNDPGAVSPNGVYEKDVTLAVARETKRKLEEAGRYRVMLTRDGDVFLELRERVAKARDAGADLFISIHADTIEQRPSISGLSIYTLSETASDREAETLAAKENRADAVSGLNLSTENKEVASILISLAQRDTTNQSNRLAGALLGKLGGETNLLPVKPHRQAGFAVLTAPDVPSVLIELGYLSNPRDLSHLTAAAYRVRLARGVSDGVDGYFKWLREARRT